MTTHHTFTALDSIGRHGTVQVRFPDPVNGSQGFFNLDRDPGSGSMYGYRSIETLTITGGPQDGLRELLTWLERPRPTTYAGDAERIEAVRALLADKAA